MLQVYCATTDEWFTPVVYDLKRTESLRYVSAACLLCDDHGRTVDDLAYNPFHPQWHMQAVNDGTQNPKHSANGR